MKPLNGLEIKELLVEAFNRALDSDTRFAVNQSFTFVDWTVEAKLLVHQTDPEETLPQVPVSQEIEVKADPPGETRSWPERESEAKSRPVGKRPQLNSVKVGGNIRGSQKENGE